MVGLAENKATQPSLAGAWAELGNTLANGSEQMITTLHFQYVLLKFPSLHMLSYTKELNKSRNYLNSYKSIAMIPLLSYAFDCYCHIRRVTHQIITH